MRVIAGIAKGRRLATPKGTAIRPVLDQVKEAIFNILFDVGDLRVLDLFAGTGAMGIEALSRGALFCVFVDSSKEALKLIGKNIDVCGFADRSNVLNTTAQKAIAILENQQKEFERIFVDPPYEKGYVKKTMSRLAKSTLLTHKTIVICEHHPKEPMLPVEGLLLTDQRKYGQSLVSFLKKQEARSKKQD